jgi:hypothetical protein
VGVALSVKVRVSARGVRELAVVDEPWRPDFAERYRSEACTGLLIGCPTVSGAIQGVEFVRELEGLRSVRLLKGIRDVSALFDLPRLEALNLDTAFRGTLALGGLPELRILETPFARGVETLGALRALSELIVFGWSAPDLTMLGEKPALCFLRIEMKRKVDLSCAGIEGAPSLERLALYEGALVDPQRLAGLSQLHEVAFRNTKVRDLGFVHALPRLKLLELDNVGDVRTLGPLAGHPTLESVAISGSTKILDGDMTPILSIPQLRSFGIERGAAHYTHTPAELRRAVRTGP